MLPVTILHGDVIQKVIGIVLRGKRVCIKGHDCGCKAQVLTTFMHAVGYVGKGNMKEHACLMAEQKKGNRKRKQRLYHRCNKKHVQ